MSMSNSSPVAPAPAVPDGIDYAKAYELLREEIATVAEDDVERVNLDVYNAANKVNGALPRLRTLKPRFASLPSFNASAVERIDLYGHAAVHAHLLYLATQPPKEEVERVYKEVFDLRDILYTEVVALCRRKLLDETRLSALRGAVGYRNAAFDVLLLGTMLLDNNDALQGRILSSREEIESAREKAHKLNEMINLKENNDAAAPALLTKQRAFTLFIRAYDEARRGLTFLRWHEDDVDDILPTIYPKKKQQEAAAPATAPANGAPTNGAPGNGAPSNGAQANSGATAPAAPGVSAPAAPALPGGGPFGR